MSDIWKIIDSGDVKALRCAIESGVNVSIKDGYGWTPLMYASQKRADLVQVLLKAGADVNVADNSG